MAFMRSDYYYDYGGVDNTYVDPNSKDIYVQTSESNKIYYKNETGTQVEKSGEDKTTTDYNVFANDYTHFL